MSVSFDSRVPRRSSDHRVRPAHTVDDPVQGRRHQKGFPRRRATSPDRIGRRSARRWAIYRIEGVCRIIEMEKRYGREVRGLLCLELWFRAFVDGERIPSVAGAAAIAR